MRWSILLVCTVLSACASQPTAQIRPDHLFNDAAFRARSAPVDTNVFALSDAMRRFVHSEIAPQLRREGRLQGLISLRNRAQLKLEFDSAVTAPPPMPSTCAPETAFRWSS